MDQKLFENQRTLHGSPKDEHSIFSFPPGFSEISVSGYRTE
jgi:hypothetical protein